MINWNIFDRKSKPREQGEYLIFSWDGYDKKYVIKTRYWNGLGWNYGDNFVTHWAVLPNKPIVDAATNEAIQGLLKYLGQEEPRHDSD